MPRFAKPQSSHKINIKLGFAADAADTALGFAADAAIDIEATRKRRIRKAIICKSEFKRGR